MYVVAINKTQKQNIINLILGNLCTHLLSMSHFFVSFHCNVCRGYMYICDKAILSQQQKNKNYFLWSHKYEYLPFGVIIQGLKCDHDTMYFHDYIYTYYLLFFHNVIDYPLDSN